MKRTWRNSNAPLWAIIFGWIIAIIIILGIVFGLLCLESWLIMLLWNATLSAIFSGAMPIGFWQAVLINILGFLLFGGIERIISGFIKKD